MNRALTALAALTLAGGLTGCGAGLDAQTYQERNNADSSNAAVGALAVRDVAIAPPAEGVYARGEDAVLTLYVANVSESADRLLAVETDAATEVSLPGGAVRVPPLGITDAAVEVVLEGLTRELRSGEYVDVVLRFETAGEERLRVPVRTTGRTDRPVYTGERFEGGEEPALQAPTGGEHHGEEEGGEDEAGEGFEGGAEVDEQG